MQGELVNEVPYYEAKMKSSNKAKHTNKTNATKVLHNSDQIFRVGDYLLLSIWHTSVNRLVLLQYVLEMFDNTFCITTTEQRVTSINVRLCMKGSHLNAIVLFYTQQDESTQYLQIIDDVI